MRCPACEAAEMVQDTRNLPYTYKGKTIIIQNVSGLYCNNCEESVLEMGEAIRTSNQMLEFNKQVNATIIDPSIIIRIRKKLNLDQQEAGQIFGGGVNAFSRYETGKAKPPLSLVKLLKVLERHPELLAEVRTV